MCQVGNADKAMEIFNLMKQKGVRPSVVTFTSLARPSSRRGNYQEVERIMHEMEAMGLSINEYFVNVLLGAYANAQPKQSARAVTLMRKVKANRVMVNDYVLTSLEKVLGRDHAQELANELGLKAEQRRPGQQRRPVRPRLARPMTHGNI